MYQSYDEAFRALIFHEELEVARGGQLIKHADGLRIRLFNQPDDEEGEIVFELNPSVEPSEDWKWAATTEEVRQAYHSFAAENSI